MERYITRSPKAHHCVERRHMRYRIDCQNWSTGAICVRDKETKKRQRKKPYDTVENGVFTQIIHVIRSKYCLAWWVVWQ